MKTVGLLLSSFGWICFCISPVFAFGQKINPTPQTSAGATVDFEDIPALLATYFKTQKSSYQSKTIYNAADSFTAYTADNQEFYTIQKIFILPPRRGLAEKLVAFNRFQKEDDFYADPKDQSKIRVQNSHATGPDLFFGIYRSDRKLWHLIKRSSDHFNETHENFGSNGYPEELHLMRYGKTRYALVEETKDYNHGIMEKAIVYRDPFSEKEILSYAAETMGTTEDGSKDFSFDFNLVPIKSDLEYWNIAVKISGTHLDKTGRKVIPYDKALLFVYEPKSQKYILKD